MRVTEQVDEWRADRRDPGDGSPGADGAAGERDEQQGLTEAQPEMVDKGKERVH